MIKTIITGGQYDDPTEWDGNNPKCTLDYCDFDVVNYDEYCEDHQRCYYCGDRENCDDDCPNNMDNLTLYKLTKNLIIIIKDELSDSQTNKSKLSGSYRLGKNEAYLKILGILTKTLKR